MHAVSQGVDASGCEVVSGQREVADIRQIPSMAAAKRRRSPHLLGRLRAAASAELDVPGGNIDPQIYPYAQPPTPLLPLLQIEGEIAYEGRNKLVHGAYEWSSFPSTSVAR